MKSSDPTKIVIKEKIILSCVGNNISCSFAKILNGRSSKHQFTFEKTDNEPALKAFRRAIDAFEREKELEL